jgi:hypothetical protein
LFIDHKNNVYIGLWAGIGMNIISDGVMKTLRLDSKTRKLDWYNDFCEDNNGFIWIGTWGSYGLIKYDQGKISSVDISQPSWIPNKSLRSHFVSCLAKDDQENIWVGTTNKGLSVFNPLEEKVINFLNNTKHDIRPGQKIQCLYKGVDGKIWIGANGLFYYDGEQNTFKAIEPNHPLLQNEIMAILEDDHRNLWIATTDGMVKLAIDNHKMQAFHTKDGLIGEEFTGAAHKLEDGRLAFGTKSGLVVFNPIDVRSNKYIPIPFLSGFKIFEEEHDSLLNKGMPIVLDYNRNYISFTFSSTEYSSPEQAKYAYRLQNFEEDWRFTSGANRVAKYTYLEPGRYNFLLKTANADGLWNEEILKKEITINPPYWLTTWFISLEVLLAMGLIYAIIKYREYNINERHEADLLEQKLLRAQMNPHFIFNALGTIQSYIFSHAPLEAGGYLAKFAQLMRSILYSSKEEWITLEEEIAIIENYIFMQKLRYEDKWTSELVIDPRLDPEITMIPPMLAQPFIENAIEHGLKSKKEKGKLLVRIKKEQKKILVSIEDNGIGIEASRAKKAKKHKSLAVEITKKRLKMLGKKGIYQIQFKALQDANGTPCGTQVNYSLPLKTDN